ncbi:putative prophage CPS-53 integrase [compost metagenome]
MTTKTSTPKKPLTDATVRNLKTPGAYPDGTVRGLFLIVTPAGTKSWRLRYWIDKKEFTYTLGVYSLESPPPARHLSLGDARMAATAAKSLVTHGQHPKDAQKAVAAARKAEQALTFGAVAQEFIEHTKTVDGWSSSTDDGHRYALKAINAIMGTLPVGEVNVGHIKKVIAHYQGKPTAQRFAFGVVKRVLNFARISRYAHDNVAVGCEALLPKRRKGESRSQRHHPAIVKVEGLTEFLRRLDAHTPHTVSWYGVRLLTLLPARAVELASMRWEDLDAGFWVYRMTKVDREHTVPLPRQALAILDELRTRRMGQCEYVLPGRDPARHLHPNTFRAQMVDQLGYEVGTVSAHGFRASWRTLGQKPLKIDIDVLEMALGHETKDPLGRAYNHNDLLEERVEAAQRWADWLDELRMNTIDKN